MLALRFPRIESYFRRCANVLALVRSLTATMSMFLSPIAARMMLRPIRPNPLIPTFTAIAEFLRRGVGQSDAPDRHAETVDSSCRLAPRSNRGLQYRPPTHVRGL